MDNILKSIYAEDSPTCDSANCHLIATEDEMSTATTVAFDSNTAEEIAEEQCEEAALFRVPELADFERNPKQVLRWINDNAVKCNAQAFVKPVELTHLDEVSQWIGNGNQAYLKDETKCPIKSFKWRGSMSFLRMQSEANLRKGFIANSAGNHAQGIAYCANILGKIKGFNIPVQIYMPKDAPLIKRRAVEKYGAVLHFRGETVQDAMKWCQEHINSMGHTAPTYIHPFDDFLMISGHATSGLEVIHDMDNMHIDFDYVFVPCGGCGLIAGILSALKLAKPHINIIGVQSTECMGLKSSIDAGKVVSVDIRSKFADGTAINRIGDRNFAICKHFMSKDDVISVTTQEICEAMQVFYKDTREILEPSGALAIAGAHKYSIAHELKDKKFIVFVSGANMDFDKVEFVKEVGDRDKRTLAARMSISDFPKSWNEIKKHQIEELSFTGICREETPNFLLKARLPFPENDHLQDALQKLGITVRDVSGNKFLTGHGGMLLGAVRAEHRGEKIFRISFHRMGSTFNFLMEKILTSEFAVTMISYRYRGEDVSSLLVGITSDGEIGDISFHQLENFIVENGFELEQLYF